MPPLAAPACAVLLAALSLALVGCGRRGPLEPPAGTAAPASTTKQVAAEDSQAATEKDQEGLGPVAVTASPSPTPMKRRRPYTVPKEPFVLDPLL